MKVERRNATQLHVWQWEGGGLFFPPKQLGEGREQGNKNTSANKGYIER